MQIREATANDFEEIWPIFQEIVSAGDTYAYPQNTSKEQAQRLWMVLPRKTFVAEGAGQILGHITSRPIKQDQAAMFATVATWSLQKQETRVLLHQCVNILKK